MISQKLIIIIAAIIIDISFGSSANSQTTPSISILSPKNETVVQPSETLQVIVASSGVTQLAIVGSNSIGATALQPGSSSLSIPFVIPANIRPGRYYIRGVGNGTGGGLVQSASVSVLVQSTDLSALQLSPNPLILKVPGSQMILDVRGTTTQGQITMDPQSLTFMSANPLVASVDVNGVVTGQSSGATSITASYSVGQKAVSATTNVQVGGSIRGDLNSDGRVDSDDLRILDAALNSPANGPNDARDLNHDGIINALDARILVTLCTYPRCATHQ